MNNIDIKSFQKKLEEELKILEKEMDSVGKREPAGSDNWVAVQPEENISNADENEVADTIDDFENNNSILRDLKSRYKNIKLALAKIKEGKYGLCEIDNKPIDIKRLEANPSARTCKEHLEENLT